MLKNPVHFFRKDVTKVTSDLFEYNFLPRSKLIDKMINEAVAYRHMLKNNVISTVPHCKKHSDLLYSSVFDDVFLDIRPVDPRDDPRFTVAVKTTQLPSNISKRIESKIRYVYRQLLQYQPQNYDLIINPKSSVYFADDTNIYQDLKLAQSFASSSNKSKPKSEFILSDEEVYYRVLKSAYLGKEEELQSYFQKVHENTFQADSIIEKLVNPSKKAIVKTLRIEMKKWCRDQGIFGNFYRFMSITYSAILSYEGRLPYLPRYIQKSSNDLSSKSTPHKSNI